MTVDTRSIHPIINHGIRILAGGCLFPFLFLPMCDSSTDQHVIYNVNFGTHCTDAEALDDLLFHKQGLMSLAQARTYDVNPLESDTFCGVEIRVDSVFYHQEGVVTDVDILMILDEHFDNWKNSNM